MSLTKKILENYDDMVIEHHNFNYTVSSVLSHVQLGSKGRILLIVGPTGVGKSTQIRYCVNELDEYVKNNPDCEYSPPIILEALAPESGTFSWTSFYLRALEKLNEPGLFAKCDLETNIAMLRDGKIPPQFKSLTPLKLRDLFERSLRVHKPIAVFIDEIQHLAKCTKQTRKTDNLDVVKSLSNTCPTTFILAGTYEARQMMYYGGQLSRRVNVVHFQRYSKSEEDLTEFLAVLRNILDEYNIPTSNNLFDNIDFLYNHSLGCIGILATWIRTAIENGITRNSRKLTIDLLRKSRLNNIQLASIFKEIHAFEVEHNDDVDFDPIDYLDLSPKKSEKDTTNKKPPAADNNVKAFQRSPKRDSVEVSNEQ